MITEENFLDFKCPYCGEPVSFPESATGSAQECPNCMASLIVPEAGGETGKMIPIPIATPRLILRRFAMNDWEALMKLLADEEFLQYTDGLAVNEEEQVLRCRLFVAVAGAAWARSPAAARLLAVAIAGDQRCARPAVSWIRVPMAVSLARRAAMAASTCSPDTFRSSPTREISSTARTISLLDTPSWSLAAATRPA